MLTFNVPVIKDEPHMSLCSLIHAASTCRRRERLVVLQGERAIGSVGWARPGWALGRYCLFKYPEDKPFTEADTF